MSHPRKGTLIYKRSSGYNARLWVDVVDVADAAGVPHRERRWFCLDTHDRELARRKMAKLVKMLAEGSAVAVAKETATKPELLNDFAEAFFTRRAAEGVVMASDERSYWKKYVAPTMTGLLPTEIRVRQCQAVLDDAGPQLAHGSVSHIKRIMVRVFKALQRAEVVEGNPAELAQLPKNREVRKERVILTDLEVRAFLESGDVDAELRLMSMVSRWQGGMRTGDVNKWDWSMLDRVHFERCIVPRAKTGKPQVLEVPAALAGALHAWWTASGRPEAGPVFPARTGKRAGQFKATRGISYAKRLRRALLKVGIVRHTCTRPADAERRKVDEDCCPNISRDPLFTEQAHTLPVDFHSFRRAFNTALAEAGVNVQQAMHLAGHSDAKTHMRYVMQTGAMQRVPAAALPAMGESPFGASSPANVQHHAATIVPRRPPAAAQHRATVLRVASGIALRSRMSSVRIGPGVPLTTSSSRSRFHRATTDPRRQREARGSPGLALRRELTARWLARSRAPIDRRTFADEAVAFASNRDGVS